MLGSPFTVVVKVSPVQPCQCATDGAGLRKARAGEQATFTHHRRVNGEPIAKGTARFFIAFSLAEGDREYAEKQKEARGAYQTAATTKELQDKGGNADSHFTT